MVVFFRSLFTVVILQSSVGVLLVDYSVFASFPGKREHGEESIMALITNSNLIFVAQVEEVTLQCVDNEPIAYISVSEVESWWGDYPEGYRMRVTRVRTEGCSGWIDESRPKELKIGTRYMFFCGRDWSWDLHEFQDELYVPVQGVFCFSDDSEIEYCEGGHVFTFENVAEKLKNACLSISFEQMMQDSDLVVLAAGFVIPSESSGFRYSPVENGTKCRVVQVLKGDFSESELEFNPKGDNGLSFGYLALISSTDESLLFLEKGIEGYGLLHGAKSYFPVVEGSLFNNQRIPMGADLVGGIIQAAGGAGSQ